MNQTLDQTISKGKESQLFRKLDDMLSTLRENNQATLDIYKDIAKLRRSNDRTFNRAKKAVEALSSN